MYKVSGELEFDVRSGVANARLAARELENVGHKARRGGEFVDKFAKRMFGARSASEYLAKTLARLGPSLIGGAVGGTALGAIVNQAKQAAEEMNKLADSLDKAVGAKAGASIGDTLSKVNSLTTAIEESAQKISKQSPLASVAAFFMNEDADRAAKSFANAVEERIRLGNLLVEQTAEQNAQSEISATLEGRLGEVYKINIAYRKRLAEISDIKGITESQREQLKILAEQSRATQTRIVLTRELASEEKKAAEEKRKSEEEFSKTTIKINDSLQKQIEDFYKKNEEAFKKSQEEKKKASEDSNRAIIESSKRAASVIEQLDRQRQEKLTQGLDRSREILEATRAGRGALDTARKRRERVVKRENFRLAQAVAPTQRQRERLAAEVSAAELPTIAQTQAGIEEGTPANLFAAARESEARQAKEAMLPKREQTFGAKDVGNKILSVLERLDKKLPAAVPQ